MGPSFAESALRRGTIIWLVGVLVATVVAFVALRPRAAPPRPAMKSFEKFKHYKPVKKCIDGRWVIADKKHATVHPRP